MTIENSKNQMTNLNNLVMFPSSKSFPIAGSMNEAGIDFYLEGHKLDLENEFEHEGFDLDESLRYSSFEEYMNRHATNSLVAASTEKTMSTDDSIKLLINDQINAINEAKAQIKYYLDEIELFLPKRR